MDRHENNLNVDAVETDARLDALLDETLAPEARAGLDDRITAATMHLLGRSVLARIGYPSWAALAAGVALVASVGVIATMNARHSGVNRNTAPLAALADSAKTLADYQEPSDQIKAEMDQLEEKLIAHAQPADWEQLRRSVTDTVSQISLPAPDDDMLMDDEGPTAG